MGVAGLGNAAAPDGLATRLLARDQAAKGHELAWIGEALKSPTSATSTTALISAMPRIACKASTHRALVPFREQAEYLFLDLLQAP